jgi:hypothetical protein
LELNVKERSKDLLTNGIVLLAGMGLGALCMVLLGCGNGLPWLGGGLIIENLLDPDEGAEDGLACYDLNANGECDDDEDTNGDSYCDALDCRGATGMDGTDGVGVDGIDGIPGPQGPPGASPPPQVIVIEVPVEDDPPRGNAWGSDGPNGNPQRP